MQWFNLTKVVLCCWEVNVLDTKLEVLFLLSLQGSGEESSVAEMCVLPSEVSNVFLFITHSEIFLWRDEVL